MTFACRLALLLAIALVMASCRTAGDFGRQRPSYFYDRLVPSARVAISNLSGVDASAYPLTQAEQELRARSHTIMENEAPSLKQRADQYAADLGLHNGNYQRKRRVAHSTGTADLERDKYPRHPDILLSAVSRDLEQLQRFAVTAAVVYRADSERLKTLRTGGDVPARDVLDATGRVSENRLLVENIILTLHNRIDDYEVELRRSLLVFPGPHKDKVDNAIGRLSDRVRRFENMIRTVNDPGGFKHDPGLLG